MIIFIENRPPDKEGLKEVGMAYALMKKARDNAKKDRDKRPSSGGSSSNDKPKGSQPKPVKYRKLSPKILNKRDILGILSRKPKIIALKFMPKSGKEILAGTTKRPADIKYSISNDTVTFDVGLFGLKKVEINLDNIQFARDSPTLDNKIYMDLNDGSSIFIDYR